MLPMLLLINVRMSGPSMLVTAAVAGVLININGPNVRSVLQVIPLIHKTSVYLLGAFPNVVFVGCMLP